MKQFLATAFLTVVAMFGIVADSDANGGLFSRNRRGGCSSCDTPVADPCATTAAPAPVQYEERKVKVMKPVMKEKEIEVLECKRIATEEKYTYNVTVPKTVQEKRKVIDCTPKYTEVDYVYTILVPKTVQKTVQVTTNHITRETVVEKVPVCRTVCVTCVDECGRCYTRRETVTVMEDRTRCIVKCTPIVSEKVVNVTICEPEQRKGKKSVCEIVRTEREVLVNVCTYVTEPRQGVRTVYSTVTEKVKRKVQYCEMVEEEQTIRVAIGGTTNCASPCNDCDAGSGHGHGRRSLFSGGLFRRGGGCCN